MKHLFLILFITLSNLICAQNSAKLNAIESSQSFEVLLEKRLELFLQNEDYISVEHKMVENGFSFPALVKEGIQNGAKVLSFKAYLVTPANNEQIKSKIMHAVPSIQSVEITGNNVKATFSPNADYYHVLTLFRILGYNAFSKQN